MKGFWVIKLCNDDQLLDEYKVSLKILRKQYNEMLSKKTSTITNDKNRIDRRSSQEIADQKTIAGMINDCLYTIYWLENGHEKPTGIENIHKLSKKKRDILWGQIDDACSFYGREVKSMNKIPELRNDIYLKKQLKKILSCLSERELEFFKLKHEAMLTEVQCAEVLGISIGTVKSMAQRIRNKIDNYLYFYDVKSITHG